MRQLLLLQYILLSAQFSGMTCLIPFEEYRGSGKFQNRNNFFVFGLAHVNIENRFKLPILMSD